MDPIVRTPGHVIERRPEVALEERPFERIVDEQLAMIIEKLIEQLDGAAVGFAFQEVDTITVKQRIGRMYAQTAVGEGPHEERPVQPIPKV
jgi:hypothetical protein